LSGKYYVTTPIYYVNDIPHIGHAYTTIAADVLARYHRLRGKDVFFLTGTDEHGQKVEEAARARGLTPIEHADAMGKNFRALWKKLHISNDAFIRTTDDAHVRTVQGLLQLLWDRGEIEKRAWKGWYCTPDERFWTEKDLKEGNCPDCGRPVELVEEENYFFLMSKYQDRLIRHIEDNPHYILPVSRRNEVLGFLKNQKLGDLCISRPRHRLSWGVPIPFDDDFVTYVWFDALLNYFSATRYLSPGTDSAVPQSLSASYLTEEEAFWWPADNHLVGKDILTTHAVYWSTMLMALNMPLPANLFAHGWWTVEGKKMSKSLNNVVDPGEIADRFGVDQLRYFLFREVPFGLDGDFSVNALIQRINSDLANDLGNLASRALNMIHRYREGKVPAPGPTREEDKALRKLTENAGAKVEAGLFDLQFQRVLENLWEIVSGANRYIEETAPWKLAKDPSRAAELDTVLYNVAETLRLLCLHLHPFLPLSTERLWNDLGQKGSLESVRLETEIRWGLLTPGTAVVKGEPLFPRVDRKVSGKSEPEKENEKEGKPADANKEETNTGLIRIEDVARVQLKTGTVLTAERVKKSKKLLRLEVNTGESRQIVAGIAEHYAPEELVGKTVVVVANLQPARLMGIESQGMLLAASDGDGRLSILTTERSVSPGSGVR